MFITIWEWTRSTVFNYCAINMVKVLIQSHFVDFLYICVPSIHPSIHPSTYIHTYIHVSVAEWLAWLISNCGRIGAIGSSPSNGLKPNFWGQKGFNPLCQCVYVYVCIVNPNIQTIHRCSHTSIHTEILVCFDKYSFYIKFLSGV